MAAPVGNQFWKLRSKHGRDKIFATPDVLLAACNEYFEATDKRVWNKIEYKGSDVTEVKIPTSVPYTLSGLCIFLDVNTHYFNDFKTTCSKDFSEIIRKVEQIIYTQKFEGAAVGAYNANIIARDLGLSDKQDLTNNGESFPTPIIKIYPKSE